MGCPGNSSSAVMSDERTDCRCNAGFEGANGSACSACDAGYYKEVNGSTACLACGSGTYLAARGGTACSSCPSNTSSPGGSDALTDCIC